MVTYVFCLLGFLLGYSTGSALTGQGGRRRRLFGLAPLASQIRQLSWLCSLSRSLHKLLVVGVWCRILGDPCEGRRPRDLPGGGRLRRVGYSRQRSLQWFWVRLRRVGVRGVSLAAVSPEYPSGAAALGGRLPCRGFLLYGRR